MAAIILSPCTSKFEMDENKVQVYKSHPEIVFGCVYMFTTFSIAI